MTETVKAYAKINLHLDITGIRADGYHNVDNVMQTVTLFDTVTVEFTDSKEISCECDVAGVPTDEKNIAVRAAKLYCESVGLNKGVRVKIEKRIPMAAGLAGGSADAAATLVALNRLQGNLLDEKTLFDIGARLGADVPFCIAGGCAYTNGRGDLLHSFPKIPDRTVFVVACGGDGVSTPWAYGLMDREHNNFTDYKAKGIEILRESLESDHPKEFYKYIFNIFEDPVLGQRPVAAQIKDIMLDSGALNAMMSGSGPSVYGVFSTEAEAEMASEAIREKGYFASVCYPV